MDATEIATWALGILVVLAIPTAGGFFRSLNKTDERIEGAVIRLEAKVESNAEANATARHQMRNDIQASINGETTARIQGDNLNEERFTTQIERMTATLGNSQTEIKGEVRELRLLILKQHHE